MSGRYPPLPVQIAELKRERGIRDRTYPTMIVRGQMSQHEADLHMAHLDAAIATLEWLQRNEMTIKSVCRVRGEAP